MVQGTSRVFDRKPASVKVAGRSRVGQRGRVNASLLLCYATRAGADLRNRLGKFPSTVIQTRGQPKTRPVVRAARRPMHIDSSSIR